MSRKGRGGGGRYLHDKNGRSYADNIAWRGKVGVAFSRDIWISGYPKYLI